MLTEWTEKHDKEFEAAVEAVVEYIEEGGSEGGALDHYSALFGIDRDALVYEYHLRHPH